MNKEILDIISIAKQMNVPISINLNVNVNVEQNVEQNVDLNPHKSTSLSVSQLSSPTEIVKNNLINFKIQTVTKYCKILIASTQWPSYGGAATNAYNLIKFLRSKGYHCAGLFHESANNKINNFDPDQIGGIWNLQRINDKADYKKISELVRKEIVTYLRGEPTICFSKNYVSPLECKLLFPNSLIVYLVSGSSQATGFANKRISIQRFLNENIEFVKNKKEIKSLEVSDYIIPNSKISEKVINKIYPEYGQKILHYQDTSFVSVNSLEIKENSNRVYDIVFITSRCDRLVKGPDIVQKIFADPSLQKYTKLVIGDKSNEYFQDIGDNIILKDSMPNKEILQHLSRSKLLISPSYYDASPNCPREALACNCYILINKNIGYSEFLDDHFVCEDNYDISEWVNKINYILQNYPNLEFPQQDYLGFFNKFSDMIYDISCHTFWNYINVEDEEKTIAEVAKGKSIARFTDSELRICLGRNGKKQNHNPDLEQQLKEILYGGSNSNLLVAIPPIYGSGLERIKDTDKWIQHNERYLLLYNHDKTYYSSFITRPDWLHESKYIKEKFMEIWKDKNVIFVNYSKNIPKMLGGCKSVHLINCSGENAYSDKDVIKNEIKKINAELILLSCGPLATVLVAELTKLGYWCIDIGSLR